MIKTPTGLTELIGLVTLAVLFWRIGRHVTIHQLGHVLAHIVTRRPAATAEIGHGMFFRCRISDTAWQIR